MKAEINDTATIVTGGVTVKLAISNDPQFIPAKVYTFIYSPVINIFKRKKTPIKRIEDIKKWVIRLDLIVKNFNNGPAITIVKVRISNVAAKYNEMLGNVTPCLKSPSTKYKMKKYTNKDLINCFIIWQ